MRLLESDADSGGNHRARCHMFFYRQKSSGQRLKTSSNSPLYFASFFGFPGAVSDLLDDNTHIHTEEPMKANASAGHESVIEVFLGQWHDSVIKLLPERGADVNTRSGRNGTPLQVATLHGRHQVVSLLLTNRADLNVTCQRYCVPLPAAAEKVHFQTFQILLDQGANVNGCGGW
ncbi:hypothetical protein N7472_006971 [Penicillium cf. griseofulvum]|uniref:Uncharacterized protein n=1 Tax=Penicillium cf. griseofulvum TaxID=2972120 RepID=A0A9W9M5G4_9EURO|nr:hypothetical protein N7472_006971 [Penicillium cf. griseofulvum]